MMSRKFMLAGLVCLGCTVGTGIARTALTPARPKQAMWLLTVRIARPELYDTAKWTAADRELGQAHYMYLDRLAQAGDVVFGGLTADVDATGKLDPETIGVAVARASDRATAERLAAADPGVTGGLVRTKVQSFNISIPLGGS
jgi:uncharacterized protein YciI